MQAADMTEVIAVNRSKPAQSWRRLGTIPTGCVLVCILQATQLAGDAKCESPSGVEFEIILDSDSVKFPDPIHGFLRVTNTSGREAFLPSLGELQHSTSLELRCGGQVVEADFAANQPARATRRPAGYSSVTPFCLRYNEPKFVQRVRERLPVLIHAKTPVRPRQIANSVAGRDTADRTSAPRFVELYETNGRPILSATAETRVRLDPGNWIFRRPDDPLIRFAAAWPAWRSDRELGEITALMKFPQSIAEIERFLIEVSTINDVPILAVFPERAFSILDRLNKDTVSWRRLKLTQLLMQCTREGFDREKLASVVDEAWTTLAQSGPAEFLEREKYFRLRMHRILTKPNIHNGPDSRKLVELFSEEWSNRIATSFQGLSCFQDTNTADRMNADQFAIEHLTQKLRMLRASVKCEKGSGAVLAD